MGVWYLAKTEYTQSVTVELAGSSGLGGKVAQVLLISYLVGLVRIVQRVSRDVFCASRFAQFTKPVRPLGSLHLPLRGPPYGRPSNS